MNIGEINNVEGRLVGSIATRTIDLPRIGLRPVESQNQRAPVFEVVARNVGGRWVQIGALWEQTSNGTGEVFLQGSLDDPSMSEPLPIALFGSDEQGYRIAWRRPQRRDDLATAARAPRQSYDGDGGFGDSTAGPGGAAGGGSPGSEIDDDLPF